MNDYVTKRDLAFGVATIIGHQIAGIFGAAIPIIFYFVI